MPLVKVDLLQDSWTEADTKKLLDVIHESLLETWDIPVRDRYQIVNYHKKNEMIVEDTGLNISRSERVIIISVTSFTRTIEQKKNLYRVLADKLSNSNLELSSTDLMVNITNNNLEDWSFGLGEAQLLDE
ncbi:tautomerase family protein [Companilactobacillus jidongensis]|uniref:tautomerase family protein n=1 Tax=Companilactobacillus jidongensis TaxID=2486006 RepID=UPI000F7B7A57|nr:tautomerase family protein [Companilactobacillus jidongensis]